MLPGNNIEGTYDVGPTVGVVPRVVVATGIQPAIDSCCVLSGTGDTDPVVLSYTCV